MSDEKTITSAPLAPPKAIEAPMTSFVRGGGTITSGYEQQLQRERADAERRRNEEDERQRATAKDPLGARMSTTRLGGSASHAAIVLEIRNSDGKAEEFITCELNVGRNDDPSELILCMCCPHCARTRGMDQAQMMFSNKHRKFELDMRKAGQLWVNPLNPSEFVTLAGTIHLTEAVRCPLCAWHFKIDDSVLKTL